MHKGSPEIKSLRLVLSPFQCDYLIAMSVGILRPSKVVSAKETGAVSRGYRTSDGGVLLPHMMDRPLLKIIRQLSKAAGTPAKNGEFCPCFATGQARNICLITITLKGMGRIIPC